MQYNSTQCNTICFNEIQGNTTQYDNTILYCVVILIYCIIIRHSVVLHYTSVYILMTWQIFEVPVATTGFHIRQKVLLARKEDRLMCGSQSWAKLPSRGKLRAIEIRSSETSIVDSAVKANFAAKEWRLLDKRNCRRYVGDHDLKNCVQLNEVWLGNSSRIANVTCYVVICFKNFFGDLTTRVMCWLRTVPAACRVLQPMFLFRI